MKHITLPYDPEWVALEWIKEHCKSYVTNDMHMDGYNTYDPKKIDYFFSDDKDQLIALLRWS